MTAAWHARSAVRPWRIARISPLGEVHVPSRVTAAAIRLVVQLLLVTALWRGLYANGGTVAGLDRTQAVTYAVLVLLGSRLREMDHRMGRDAVVQHLDQGTIAYWFLRPIAPSRYHGLRVVGDQIYGLAWALLGAALCTVAGVLGAPHSGGAAVAFVGAVVLGQMLLYRLALLVDLACFWTLRTYGSMTVVRFAQSLMSGAIVPLWYFPGWFRTIATALPFRLTVNDPLSIYIGRIDGSGVAWVLLGQIAWLTALSVLTRWLWGRAHLRLTVQGG